MSELPRVPVAGPWITAHEIAYVTDAVTHGWYDQANVYQQRFEAAFAAHLGVKHAVALPSCTSAIHLALAAAGIGPGDEVIVPELTWIASAAPIDYVGATVVFADVDPVTWCLAPASLEAAITPRTRAIIPVDLYGNMPDMTAIRAIATRHNLIIIEDAAQAIGATLDGRPAGSFGDMGVFSFHGSKTLTTGEGGMWVSDNDAWYERLLFLRDHGRAPGNRMFWNTEVAFKYRMSAMQAALGLAQLERLPELVARKRAIFAWYREALQDLPGLAWNVSTPGSEPAYWMTTVILDPSYGLPKDVLMERLYARGIDARPVFYPLGQLPAYAHRPAAQAAALQRPVAHALSPYGINLPSALDLTQATVQRVATAFRAALAEGASP